MDTFEKEKKQSILETGTQNKVINFISKQNQGIEKQLAKCMKEIQQLMALKNHKLRRLNTIKIS